MEIVLVHLNTKIPVYLKRNLIRLSKIFPDHSVVLISNIEQPKILNVEFKLYTEPEASKEINFHLSHPKEFRSNFWHSSIARFTYLRKYQEEVQRPVLHVESDVILSKDFPLKLFAKTEGLAYPILSKFRGVASIFYSSGSESINSFVEFLVNEAQIDHEITDMTALRKYYDLHPRRITILPAGPANASCYEDEVLHDVYDQIKSGLVEYRGVFDGSDIGMYLFGTDPRNLVGKTILRQEISSTYTRMSQMNFKFNPLRQFLDIESQGEWIPVYNIHMTCKDKKLFSTKNFEKRLTKYLRFENCTVKFLPEVYVRMALAKIKRTILAAYR